MKKFLIALILAAAATAAHAAFYANMVEEDTYLSAVEAMDKKDYEGARKGFASFIEKFRESKYRPVVLLRLAELSPDIETAARHYNDVIKEFPDSEHEAEAVFSLGRLYYASGGISMAKTYFNIIMQKYSTMIWVEETYYYLMLCALKERDYKGAEKTWSDYSAGKNYFIFRERINLAYADSLYDSGRFKDAAEKYGNVIGKQDSADRNIHMPHVYYRYAEALSRSGDAAAAEKAYSDLRFKFPDSPEAQGKAEAQSTATAAPARTQRPAVTAARTDSTAEDTAAGRSFYTIQVGAYTNKVFAGKLVAKFRENKHNVFTKEEGKFLKIYIGKFASKEEAETYAKKFAKKEKISSYLVKQGWE